MRSLKITNLLSRCISVLVLVVALLAGSAGAQNFTFQFKNPGFGGHPNNFQYFMQTAEAQKKEFREEGTDRFRRDPLQDFQQTMQRQMLSQLSRNLVRGEFEGVDLSSEGLYDLGDFTIEVIPGLDEISIEIIDQISGERTQVQIPRF